MSYVLQVEGLRKEYSGFALQDIDFALEEECFTGFIGTNGAGKTTTIRTILGLAKRQAGKVTAFGKPFDGSQKELMSRIGIVMDDGCFYEELTISQMKSVLAPAYTQWSESDFQGYLKSFGLDKKQKIAILSKGMKMKFSLSLALAQNADLLIMDEPTSGLDPKVRAELMDILQAYMAKGGKTIFFSTHITSDLDKVADKIILIDQGRIVLDEGKDDLLERHRIVKGAAEDLQEPLTGCLHNVSQNQFGFTALTDDAAQVRAANPNVVLERASTEDIMLGYIGREAL